MVDNKTINNLFPLKQIRLKLHFLLYFLFFVILIIGTVYGIYLSFFKPGPTAVKTKATTSGVNLSLIPLTITGTVGMDFTVTITMNTNNKTVSAAELHLIYDSTKLEGKSITAGAYLPVVLTQGTIGTGAAAITLGSQPTEPKNGSGILATLTFKPLVTLSSQISFSTETKIAVVGSNTNEVGDMNGTQITFDVSPTVTPTPSLIPGPSATPTVTPSVPPTINPTPTSTLTPTSSPTPTPIQTLQVPNTPTSVAQQTLAGRRIAQTLVITNPPPSPVPIVAKPSLSLSPTIIPTHTPVFPTSVIPQVSPSLVPKPTAVAKKPITGISFIDNILHFFGL